jgi:hypothetical protein
MIVRITISIPEEVEELLTALYIQELQEGKHTTRSKIVAQALQELYDKRIVENE